MEDNKATDSPKLSIKERAKIQAQLGNIKQQTVKVVTGKKGDNRVLETHDVGDESFATNGTIYFKNCEDCEYVVNAPSVKVLIEGCKQCKVTINGHVKTEILEIWKSQDFSLMINTSIKTLQADMCSVLSVRFVKAELLGNVVWAGIQELSLHFDDHHQALKSGVEAMQQEVPDLNPETDQFIVRFLEGKLTQELIVRLENGFPTTEREADAFDEKAKRNAELAEAYVRKLVEESKITLKSKEEVEKEKKEGEERNPSAQAEPPKVVAAPSGKTNEGEKEPVTAEAKPKPEGGSSEEEERKKVPPARTPSKKPERVYIGIDN